MLTLKYPNIFKFIQSYPGGLSVVEIKGQKCLVVKTSKESILAAKCNENFKVYVVPIPFPNGLTVGLMTAFFDDHDEPLSIRTLLFGDEKHSYDLINVLNQDFLDVYFFDELSRELMSFRCEVIDGGSLLRSNDEVVLLPSDAGHGLQMLEIIGNWFGLRGSEDDEKAITLKFVSELWPTDIVFTDFRDTSNDFIGSSGVSTNMLERENPGSFQEMDIIGLFKRSFEGLQLILNPRNRHTKKEIADVMAGGEDAFIIVQAKDSPNTEVMLNASIRRKLLKSKKQVYQAIGQAKGALDFVRKADPVPLWLNEKDLEIDLYVNSRNIVNLVIVKEIFPMQEEEIISSINKWKDRGDILLVIDYMSFHAITFEFDNESDLVEALFSLANEQYIKQKIIRPDDFARLSFKSRWEQARGVSDI